MLEIYRKLRPGEPPTLDSAETLMQNLFFDPRRYDLSIVGRYKFNKKLTLWTLASPASSWLCLWPTPPPARSSSTRASADPAQRAEELDAIGVAEVSVKLDSGDVIRVFTNGWCDMAATWISIPRSAASTSGCASPCCRSCWTSTAARS